MSIEKGSKVRIRDNLRDELAKLGFNAFTCEDMHREFSGKVMDVYSTWASEGDGQVYATVDMCVEIPIQCCELIASK